MSEALTTPEDSTINNGSINHDISDKLKCFVYVKDLQDVPLHINTQIYEIYKTTAVTAIDILSQLHGDNRLRLDLYQQPIWAIAVQIDEDVVKEAVEACLKRWETNNYAINFVDKFLLSRGIQECDLDSEKQKLLKQIPDVLKNEKSPDVYKLYKAVEILTQTSRPKVETVFSNENESSTFVAGMLNYEEEKVPIKLAAAVASDDVGNQQQKSGVTSTVGAAVGKVVALKYSLADSYESAMKNSMGEYADRYESDKQLALEKKEQIRVQRAEELKARKDAALEEKKLDRQSARDNQRLRTINQIQAASVTTENRYIRNNTSTFNGNISPTIPTWLIAVGTNMLLILIIAIVVGWGGALLPGAGLIIATVGFFKNRANDPKALQTIILGYSLAAITIILL